MFTLVALALAGCVRTQNSPPLTCQSRALTEPPKWLVGQIGDWAAALARTERRCSDGCYYATIDGYDYSSCRGERGVFL